MTNRSIGFLRALTLAAVASLVVSGCKCGGGGEMMAGGGSGGNGGGTGGGGATNHPPTLEALQPVMIDEGKTTQVTVTATDPDGDAVQLTLTSPPSWLMISGNVISLAPTFSDSGSYEFTITASDGKGGVSAATLAVTVNNAGNPPMWTAIAPVTMNEAMTRQVTLLAIDPDGQAVTYSLTMSPPPWATLAGNMLTLAPGYDVVMGSGGAMGTFNVFVEARNPAGAMALTSVVVVVLNTDRAPVFADFAVTVDEGTPASIPLAATDPDQGDTVSFAFAGTPPGFVSLSGSTLSADAGFLASAGSPYTIVLNASDGTMTTPATLTLTVNDVNGPPQFDTIAAVTLDEGQNQQVTLVAADPDGDAVQFRVVGTLPAWATMAAGVVTLQPDYSAAAMSPYTFTFEAYDGVDGGIGHAVQRTLTVTVRNVNRDPTIDSINDVSLAELSTLSIDLAPKAADPDAESLTFTVTDDKGGTAIGTTIPGLVGQFNAAPQARIVLNPKTGSFTLSPVTITVTVADPSMRTASTSFRVFISSTNTPPTVGSLQQYNALNSVIPPGQTAGLGDITLQGAVADPQGDNAKVQAEVRLVGDSFVSPDAGLPSGTAFFEGALAQADAGVIPTVRLSQLPSGDYKWQLRAVDEGGLAGPWVQFAAGGLAFSVPPQDITGSIAVNANAATTSTALVSVNLSLQPGAGASSITIVELSDTGTFTGMNVVPYAPTIPWTLPGTSGLKTVYVKAFDNLGRSAVFSDSIVLDTVSPTIDSFSVNANSAATNNTNVTLSFTASDVGTGVVSYEASNDGSTFVAISSTNPVSWALSAGEGVKTVTLRITDGAGNVTTATDGIVLDTTRPNVSSVIINGGAAYATSTAVMVLITASDSGGSGLTQACLGEAAPANCVAFTMTTAVPFTLSAGDALKAVQVKVRDAAGNESNPVAPYPADSIVLDTSAPSVSGVTINNGAAWSTSAGVTVTLNATDTNTVDRIAFSTDGSTFGPDQAYVAAGNGFTLPGADGSKRVYVRVKDPAGNASTVGLAASDDIGLDTVAPSIGSFNVNSNASGTGSTAVNLFFTATDATSGLGSTSYSASNNGMTFTAINSASPAAFTLTSGDGPKTVTLKVVDQAGNVSTATDSIALDGTAPTLTAVSLQGGAAFTNQTNISVGTTASDVGGSGLAEVCITNMGGTTQCFPYVATYSPWTLTAGDGAKTVVVQVKDGAGNTSSIQFGSITVDTVLPVLTSITVNAGAAYTTTTAVTVTAIASDATSTVADIAFSNDNVTFGAYVPFTMAGNAHTLSATDGTKTVYARVRDGAGNVSTVQSDAIILDTSPPSGTITLAGGAAAINTTMTTYTVSAADPSGVQKMCVRETPATQPAAGDPCFVAYGTAATAITLSATQGTKTVYAWFLDNSGLVSASAATATTVLDTVAPTLSGASLNAGATFTSTTAASMAFTASDATSALTQVCVSATMTTPLGGCVAYANPAAVTLSAGDGTKTLYVQVKDAAGNLSPIISDTIIVDTASPTGTVTLAGGAAAVSNISTNYTVNASDTNGVQKMCVRESAAQPLASDPCFVSYTTAATSIILGTGDGTKTVYAWFIDNAGLMSAAAATDTIVLDTVAPTLSAPSLNAGAAYTSLTAVSMGFSASDTGGSGITQVCMSSTMSNPVGGCVPFANPASFTLPAGDGAKTVYLQVQDAAGNLSAVVNDSITLDTAGPSGTVVLNGGAAVTNSTSATYVASATDTSGIASMCVRESAAQPGASDPCFVAYSTAATPITLSADGLKTVYAWFKDNAGVVSPAAATDTITLDTVPPTLSGASLNANATYTTALGVTMGFTASDTGGSGLDQVCMSTTPGSPQGGCVPYANPANFTLTAPDGAKTVYLQVKDLAGNVSTVISDAITLDTTGPTGSVTLAGGAPAINAVATTYAVTATDASGVQKMCVRESAAAPLANDPCFVAYSTAATAITLSAGDGTKTVRAWFLDNAGLVSSTATLGSVLLDTVAPAISLASLNAGAATTNQLTVSMGFTASDTGGSGLAQVCTSASGTSPLSGCVPYANPAAFVLATPDGTKTVFVQVKDAAGNLSAVVSDTIDLVTNGPVGTVVIAAGAAAINSITTTYTVSATDPLSTVTHMCVRESAAAPAPGDPCFVMYGTGATAITLSGGDGTKTVYAWFKNAANVVSGGPATDTIVLDTVAPAISAALLSGGAAFTTQLDVAMGFTASDTGGSGLARVCLSTTPGSPQGGCIAYTNPATFTLSGADGSKTVYVQVIDVAGNLSAVLSDGISLDTTPPNGSVLLAAGASAVNGLATTYTATAADNTSGVQKMCVRESPSTAPAAADPCFVTYSTAATAITLSSTDGTKTVYAWFLDNAGLVSASAAIDTILLDTVAPVLASPSLNGGATYTTSVLVSMTFSATEGGSGLAQVCMSNTPGDPQGGCVAYANPAGFTLPAVDGNQTVYLQVKDVAGNRSAVLSDGITLDTTPPTGTVTIASGAAATKTAATTFTVTGSDASGITRMCVREGATQPLSTDACFVAFSTGATAVSLSAGDGTKTLYAWFLDTAGNVSATAATDTIILDTIAPSLSAPSLNLGASLTNSVAVSMGFTGSDTGGSGLAQICMSITAGDPQGGCVAFANPAPFSLAGGADGIKTVYVQLIDLAGNRSTVLSDTIILDTAGPTAGTVTLASGAPALNRVDMGYVVSATDTNGVSKMCVRESPSTQPAANDPCFIGYTTAATPITLSTGDGTKTVYAWFQDAANNVSATAATDTILLDTVPPALSAPSLNAGAAYTNALGASMGFTASDTGGSGLAQVCLSTTPGSPQGGCVAYVSPAPFTLPSGDGAKTVYLQVTDVAGNLSTVLSDAITLDTAGPAGSLVLAGAAAAINSTTTTYAVVAGDATSGVQKMCVREASGQPGASDPCFIAYSTAATAITLSTGDGNKTAYAWFLDNAGNVSAAAASDSVLLDTVVPTISMALLNGGAALTAAVGVSMSFGASDTGSGLFRVCMSTTPGSPQGGCATYANPAGFTLPAGDGAKTVYVQVADAAGNLSAVLSDSITLDTAPPTGTVVLAGGAAAVASLNTTYVANASDVNGVQKMCVRESPATQPLPSDACFVTYSTVPTAITLTSANGTKTVYAWFLDNAGNVSSTAATETVVLDTVLPSLSGLSINGGSLYTNSIGVSLAFTASDTGSGLSLVCRSSTAGSPQGGCTGYVNPASFTLPNGDGAKTVYLQVTDVAGNLSTVLSDTITLDTVAPTLNTININGGNAYTNSTTVTVTTGGAMDTNGIADIAFSNDGTSYGGYVVYNAAGNGHTITSGDGLKTVSARVRDPATNVSVVRSDTIVLDTALPTGTVVINSDATYSTSQTVTLTLTGADGSGSGVSGMCLKTVNTAPTTTSDLCWEVFATTRSGFDLGATQGSRIVYAWFLDAAGNISSGAATDTIILDTVLPTTPNPPVCTVGHRFIDCTSGTSTDGTSGIQGYQLGYSITSGSGYLFTSPISMTPSWVINGLQNEVAYYVVARAIDNAGNVSANSTQYTYYPRFPFTYEHREPTSANFNAVVQVDQNTGVAVGDFGVARRTTAEWGSSARLDVLSDGKLNGLHRDTYGGLYVAGDNGHYAWSDDDGLHWLKGTVNDAANLNAITYVTTTTGGFPVSTYHWYVAVGANGKILRGARQHYLFPGYGSLSLNPVTTTDTRTLRAVCLTANGSYLVAVGDGGAILRSADDGVTWTVISPPAAYATANFRTCAAYPGTSTPNRVYIGTRPTSTVAPGTASLLYFDANGSVASESGYFTGISVYGLAFAMNGTTIVPFATGAAMSGTTELTTPRIVSYVGGQTIETTPAGVTTGGRSIAALYDSVDTFYHPVSVGLEGQITYDTNWVTAGPNTWNDGNAGVDQTLFDMSFAPNNLYYGYAAGGSGTVIRSTNAGGTWSPMTLSPVTTNAFYGATVTGSATPYTAFMVGAGGFIYTTNTGTTTVSQQASPTTNQLNDVDCISPTDCYAVGAVHTILQYNGTSWSNLATGGVNGYEGVTTYLSGGVRRAILVGGPGGISRYFNGTSWSAEATNESGYYWYSADANGSGTVLAISSSRRVYRSLDHGATWSIAATLSSAYFFRDIVHANGTNWYLVGDNGVIFKSTDDGSSWTLLISNSGTGQTLYGAGFGGFSSPYEYIYACGVNGTILRSPYGGE